MGDLPSTGPALATGILRGSEITSTGRLATCDHDPIPVPLAEQRLGHGAEWVRRTLGWGVQASPADLIDALHVVEVAGLLRHGGEVTLAVGVAETEEAAQLVDHNTKDMTLAGVPTWTR